MSAAAIPWGAGHTKASDINGRRWSTHHDAGDLLVVAVNQGAAGVSILGSEADSQPERR
jgi:hypothetical protein